MSTRMSPAEREEFLAGVHVGVLSVVSPAGGSGPLTVPVWYSYEPGGKVSLVTGRTSRKAMAIQAAGRFSLCAQDERPPYRYVTAEGPATVEEATRDERRSIARRYLGPEDGDAFIAADPDDDSVSVMIRMTPEHWLTADFGKDFGQASD
ncbi:MAG: pyridoxamine 5'-phosphate oxidase family protein [Streptosporangiaceae bacterium]